MLYEWLCYLASMKFGDTDMLFDEMKPRIRYRLLNIRVTDGENIEKKTTR